MTKPNLANIAIVLPIFNPEPCLGALVSGLLEIFPVVVVVDDGSVEHEEAFDLLPPEVRVLRHGENRGKGRAMKTGLSYVSETWPDVNFCCFADGDGQHRMADVAKVAARSIATGRVCLGVRRFDSGNVPVGSRFGNAITAFLVRMMYGLSICDTQTGLRVIPRRLFADLLNLPGERYDFEMRLFGLLNRRHESLETIPIDTVYIAGNRASHFRPLLDSWRVYRSLFAERMRFVGFCMSSIVAFAVDNLIFSICVLLLQGGPMTRSNMILIAIAISRAVSSTVNYLCNRIFVFHSNCLMPMSYMRYWICALIVVTLSYSGTATLSALFEVRGLMITAMKICVEVLLFLLSYKLQKTWVFRRTTQDCRAR